MQDAQKIFAYVYKAKYLVNNDLKHIDKKVYERIIFISFKNYLLYL